MNCSEFDLFFIFIYFFGIFLLLFFLRRKQPVSNLSMWSGITRSVISNKYNINWNDNRFLLKSKPTLKTISKYAFSVLLFCHRWLNGWFADFSTTTTESKQIATQEQSRKKKERESKKKLMPVAIRRNSRSKLLKWYIFFQCIYAEAFLELIKCSFFF